jgi:hypothetical protein
MWSFTPARPARLERLLLLRRDQTSHLLLRLLVELADFLLLLLWRKRRIAAHGLHLAVCALFNLFALLHCGLRDACLLPTG